MCGRFNLITDPNLLQAEFGLDAVPDEIVSRYNIAPTQPVAAVRLDKQGARELTHFHWGLIPSWAKDPKIGSRMINARSETAHEKPSFRAAFKRRRCLVPMTGFYEWQKLDSKRKQPMHIGLQDRELFAVAGLWEYWNGIESCTLLTGAPNEFTEPLHNRMPIILQPDEYDLWLDVEAPLPAVQSLFEPFSAEPMIAYPISTYVNKAGNEGIQCIQPLT